ncbi:unnamed protein product [Phytophthora fragariaefolia]|uniref:peptidylprolyl isomerase n=1 Tax=Phytophthora fragariaefolia TaxID=1490495 RepID=A0A9W7CWV5_9STRA|nr:unnamed protein product [Phytophthora fragariaefolia]
MGDETVNATETPVEVMEGNVDEVLETREQQAAACLQRMFRCRKARLRLRQMLASVFEKYFDADTGLYYYLDKRTGETTWDKPRVLRDDDDIELTAVYDGKEEATSQAEHTGRMEVVDLDKDDNTSNNEEVEVGEAETTEGGEAQVDDKYLGYSAQDLALAREQFAHYDADSSGSINAAELHKLFTNLGEQLTLNNVRELIKAVDTDGNGEVDFDEFLHLLRKQQDKNQYSASLTLALMFGPKELTKLKQQFLVLDTDGSGAIDENELQQLVKKLGRRADEFDLPAMLREVDADGSGTIGFNEFLQIVATMTKDEGPRSAFAALLDIGIAQGLLKGLDEVVQASRQKIYEWLNADLIAEQKRLALKRERRRRQEEERQRQLAKDRELYAKHQAELAALDRARHAQVEGLMLEVEFEGDGRNFPIPGQFARVHYVASFERTGEIFESTRARCGSALEFCVGAGHTITGFDLALQRMSVGETARVTIAPALAYGVKGRPPRIPPNAALVFRIELISIKEKLQPSIGVVAVTPVQRLRNRQRLKKQGRRSSRASHTRRLPFAEDFEAYDLLAAMNQLATTNSADTVGKEQWPHVLSWDSAADTYVSTPSSVGAEAGGTMGTTHVTGLPKADPDTSSGLEKIAGILSTEQHTVPPRLLTLYLAQKKGETTWMKHDRNTESFLQGGIDTGYDKMLSSWKLDENYFGEDFQPGREDIHVLVELPLSPRQKTGVWDDTTTSVDWSKAEGPCPALEIEDDPFVRIPVSYVRDSGLDVTDTDLLLYRRPQLVAEWQSLKTHVCNTYAELWILGPPGTGKSCAAFAFACSLDRTDWDVVWIHFSKRGIGALRCIHFHRNDEKWTCNIEQTIVRRVLNSLPEQTIVFVDGYTAETDQGKVFQRVLLSWRNANKENRRLVWVSSMVTRGMDYWPGDSGLVPVEADAHLSSKVAFNMPPPKNKVRDEEIFELVSWTLEEYEAALENEDFYDHVKYMLSSDSTRWNDRDLLLKTKFSVVGGSARYMFNFSTEEAERILKKAVDATPNLEDLLKRRVDIASTGAVNRLFSCCVFFATLVHGGVNCYAVEKDSDPSTKAFLETWTAKEVPYFDPNGTIPLNERSQWLAPRLWNQGGYDAVLIETREPETDDDTVFMKSSKAVKVRFVQVTRAKKHPFKESFFKSLLTRLNLILKGYWFEQVEVCCVVPSEKLVSEGFEASVNEQYFAKEVLEPAGLSKDITGIIIRIIGVEGGSIEYDSEAGHDGGGADLNYGGGAADEDQENSGDSDHGGDDYDSGAEDEGQEDSCSDDHGGEDYDGDGGDHGDFGNHGGDEHSGSDHGGDGNHSGDERSGDFDSGESEGEDVGEDEDELGRADVDEDGDVLSESDAVDMDDAFIDSLMIGENSLRGAAKKQRAQALRATAWTSVSSDFEVGVTAYARMNNEMAQPVAELRALTHSPLLTFLYFMPKAMWVMINRETNRFAL